MWRTQVQGPQPQVPATLPQQCWGVRTFAGPALLLSALPCYAALPVPFDQGLISLESTKERGFCILV